MIDAIVKLAVAGVIAVIVVMVLKSGTIGTKDLKYLGADASYYIKFLRGQPQNAN